MAIKNQFAAQHKRQLWEDSNVMILSAMYLETQREFLYPDVDETNHCTKLYY